MLEIPYSKTSSKRKLEMEQGKQLGDWKCLRVLGKGSFGIVGLWKNLSNGNLAALKKFEVRSFGPSNIQLLIEMKERWKKEVDMMYNIIDSQYIVSTYPVPNQLNCLTSSSLSELGQLPVLCMEYCSGGDLRHMLKRPENISGLTEKEVIRIISHIGQAILYLHERNIIHRDLKPENILIHHQPTTFYKLSDLGFAKDLSDSTTLCSTVVGTLQYLAPEIYMGKMYDKTVDYWSFGIIAFEITCGMRPFLHGESPSQWIPHVEDKAADVICISRTEDGRVVHSKDIPYNTHLSIPFKLCFETWLKTMLQLDQSRRGYKLTSSNPVTQKRDGELPDDQTFGLRVLANILTFQYLDILTPQRRLSYSVRKSAIIADIQEWIARDIGLNIEHQLLFTLDGIQPKKEDPASKFVQLSDLYCIPKNHKWIRQKSKLSKDLNNFLTTYETVRDPIILRKAWGSAIYYVQVELNQVETLKKMSDILRNWMGNTCTSELKHIHGDADRTFASFKRILEFETKLEEIDEKFGFNVSITSEDWRKEAATLHGYYEKCLNDWSENLVLKIVRTSEVEEIYHKILKSYEDWRNAESGTQTKAGHVHNLVRNLCNFMVQRDQILDQICQNIGMQLERADSGAHLIEKLRRVGKRFDEIIHEVMQNRCLKQQELLRAVFKSQPYLLRGNPSYIISNSTSEIRSTTTTVNDPVYAVPHRMYKSTDASEEIKTRPADVPTGSLDGTRITQVESVNEIPELMIRSQIIQLQLEGSLNSIHTIMKEKDELDWEFLD